MANALKYFVRSCSQKCATQKTKSLFLMGTLEECASANSSIKNLSNKDLIHAHRSFFSQFVSESLEMFKGEEFVDVRRRFERVCHYNGQDRELYPGFTMMCAYKVFEKSDKLTSENLRDMSMLAWCFESLATSAILTDDIMDNEGFRWKNPCWFRQPNVGMTALTDFSLLRASGFYMMKKYFGGHPCYQTLFYLMNKMIEGMVVGQTIDINVEKAFKNSRKINLLKMEDYINACRYKCYVPIFRYCVLAVMHLLDRVHDFYPYEKIFESVTRHCQITNDLWDCFGKFESFGRGSTDIKEGKLTWVVIKALEHANDKQKALIEQNYARPEPECERIVLDVYKEVDVVGKFFEYKAKLIEDLVEESKKAKVQEVSEIIQAFVDMYVDVNEDLSY